MIWQCVKETLEVGSWFATIFGVGAAYYYGRRELNAWKAQQKGVADHELAKRVMMLLYKYKAAMVRLRSAVTTSYDFGLDEGEQPDPDFKVERHNQTSRGFFRRWGSLGKVRVELDDALLECQVVWGKSINELFCALNDLENEWYMYMILYIRTSDPKISDGHRLKWKEVLEGKENVLHDSGDDDKFRKRFDSSFQLIEEFLKNKLI